MARFPSREERERRQVPRYRHAVDVEVVSQGETRRCKTADVSLYGAFVVTEQPAELNTVVRLKLTQGLADPIEWMGRVCHVVSGPAGPGGTPGMGLEIFGATERNWDRWVWFVGEAAQRCEELQGPSWVQQRAQSDRPAARPPRTDVRFKTPIEVVVSSMPELIRFAARDISAGGMFLGCKTAPPVGSVIDLVVRHPVTGDTFPLRGRVLRVESEGVAIQFIELDDTRKQLLRRFIVAGRRPA